MMTATKVLPGIPEVIQCGESFDMASTGKQDASTADETYSVDDDESADSQCSDDDGSVKSHHTHHTNDSTRWLLQQAQARLKRQSAHEEAKALRVEVSQLKTNVEFAMRKNQGLKDTCDNLEHQLAEAIEAISAYKVKEQRWNEEIAEREKDHMNQLNDICSDMKAKEESLMAEIFKRDAKIVELQNVRNAEEMRKMQEAKAKEQAIFAVRRVLETPVEAEFDLDDDESWCDEDGEDKSHCSGNFI